MSPSTPGAETTGSPKHPLTACGRMQHTTMWRLYLDSDDGQLDTIWVCAKCHPPARGLTVQWADGRIEISASTSVTSATA